MIEIYFYFLAICVVFIGWIFLMGAISVTKEKMKNFVKDLQVENG